MSQKVTKIAFISGGSRGLGRSMAEHLARHGCDVVFTYVTNQEAADQVVSAIGALGRRAVALQLDVMRHGSFDAFAKDLKATLSATWRRENFDYLINNAGFGSHALIKDTDEEVFDQMVDTLLKAPFFLTQKLLPLVKDGGRIINISSGLARFTNPGFAAYAMMKGGIEVFTRYLAKELGERRIVVNTVAPGAIETDFGGGVVRDNAEMNQLIASQTPLGRVGKPEDIGGAVAALLMDETGWINGQRIEISGGIFG
jgi:NAD(P)-dependent dehydrogenase (short-subunit alcohol dehydrogenase family)